MVENTDLFETVKNIPGCEYISDLRSIAYLSKAKMLMKSINLEPFSLGDLVDMAEYLYGRKATFADKQEAARFFKSEKLLERDKES